MDNGWAATPFPLALFDLQAQASYRLARTWHLWVARRVTTYTLAEERHFEVRCSIDLRVPNGEATVRDLASTLAQADSPMRGPEVFVPVTCLPVSSTRAFYSAFDDNGRHLPLLDRTENNRLRYWMLRQAIVDARPETSDVDSETWDRIAALFVSRIAYMASLHWTLDLFRPLPRRTRRRGQAAGVLDPVSMNFLEAFTITSAVSDRDEAQDLLDLVVNPVPATERLLSDAEVFLGGLEAAGPPNRIPSDTERTVAATLRDDSATRAFLELLSFRCPVHVLFDPREGRRQIIKLDWRDHAQTTPLLPRLLRPVSRPLALPLPILGGCETQHIQWDSIDSSTVASSTVAPLTPFKRAVMATPGPDIQLSIRFWNGVSTPDGDAVGRAASIRGRMTVERGGMVIMYLLLPLWNFWALDELLRRGPLSIGELQVWLPLLVLVPGLAGGILPLATGKAERGLLTTLRHAVIATCVAAVIAGGIAVAGPRQHDGRWQVKNCRPTFSVVDTQRPSTSDRRARHQADQPPTALLFVGHQQACSAGGNEWPAHWEKILCALLAICAGGALISVTALADLSRSNLRRSKGWSLVWRT